jgi:hypothetical protein
MTNVAHGVRGIIWYAYRGYNKNFGVVGNFGEGIVDCGNRSPLIKGSTPQRTEYDAVREINRYLACIVGPAVMASDFINVYHIKISGPDANGTFRTIPGQSYIPAGQILKVGAEDPVLLDIGNRNVMAGTFRDKVDTTVYYVFLVNKNWRHRSRPVSGLSATLRGDMRYRVFCAPRAFGYDGNTAFTALQVTYDARRRHSIVTLPDPLLSGEARLLKVIAPGPAAPHLPGFRPNGSIASVRDPSDGRILCMALGIDNRLYVRVQDTADVDFWGAEWRLACRGQAYGSLSCRVLGGRSGRIAVFSSSADGSPQYSLSLGNSYSSGKPLFSDWKSLPLPDSLKETPACPYRCSDPLRLFTTNSKGHLCEIRRGKDSSALSFIGSCPVTAGGYPAAVAENGDGRLTVFFVCAGGANVFFSSQGKKGTGVDWQNPLPLTNLSDQDQR